MELTAANMLMAASAAGTAMSVVGNMQQADAARQAGQAQQQQAQFQAQQDQIAAGQAQAAAQQKALKDQADAQMMASRLVAAAGAGGGGVTDPTIVNLLTDISGKGHYNAAMDIYNGESQAQKLQYGAEGDIYSGAVAAAGGQAKANALETSAFGSALSGGASLYAKYGGPGAPPATNNLNAQQG